MEEIKTTNAIANPLEVESLPQTNHRLPINFQPGLRFISPSGGEFAMLPPEASRSPTQKDIDNGYYTRQEKVSAYYNGLLNYLGDDLANPEMIADTARMIIVEGLQNRIPQFLPIRREGLNPAFLEVAGKFEDGEVGIMVVPMSSSVVMCISSLRFPDGKISRLLALEDEDVDLDHLNRVSMVTPPLEARKIDQGWALAVEFIRNGELPVTITPAELADWMQRLEQSRIEVTCDFSTVEGQKSLDNFIRYNGKLYWVDGDIVVAKSLDSPEEAAQHSRLHGERLQHYLKLD